MREQTRDTNVLAGIESLWQPVWSNSVDDWSFATMEIDVIAGRSFAPTDDADAPAVAIVNDTLARHFWHGADPIGKRLQILEPGGPLVQVVGVVRTITYGFPGERGEFGSA